jgi:hypothetical protein
MELNAIVEKFPGFTVILNHLGCDHCGALDGDCRYGILLNCEHYAKLTLLRERHPQRQVALALAEDCLWQNYGKFAKETPVETLEEADFVYYNGGHVGINRGNGFIESKWGSLSRRIPA